MSITDELKLTFLALQYNKLVEDKALKITFNPKYSIQKNIKTAFDDRLSLKKKDIAAVIRDFIDPMTSNESYKSEYLGCKKYFVESTLATYDFNFCNSTESL